jgi:uncharacterized Zn finger protein
MVVCEQCGGRRLRSWIVERAQGRLVITECQSCGKRSTRWFGDPLSAPKPAEPPRKTSF